MKMHLPYPIKKEYVNQFKHRYVGVVLHDGRLFHGIVTGCRNDRLILNGHLKKLTNSAKKSKNKARKAALPYGGPNQPPQDHSRIHLFGPYAALNLADIALLFPRLP